MRGTKDKISRLGLYLGIAILDTLYNVLLSTKVYPSKTQGVMKWRFPLPLLKPCYLRVQIQKAMGSR